MVNLLLPQIFLKSSKDLINILWLCPEASYFESLLPGEAQDNKWFHFQTEKIFAPSNLSCLLENRAFPSPFIDFYFIFNYRQLEESSWHFMTFSLISVPARSTNSLANLAIFHNAAGMPNFLL